MTPHTHRAPYRLPPSIPAGSQARLRAITERLQTYEKAQPQMPLSDPNNLKRSIAVAAVALVVAMVLFALVLDRALDRAFERHDSRPHQAAVE